MVTDTTIRWGTASKRARGGGSAKTSLFSSAQIPPLPGATLVDFLLQHLLKRWADGSCGDFVSIRDISSLCVAELLPFGTNLFDSRPPSLQRDGTEKKETVFCFRQTTQGRPPRPSATALQEHQRLRPLIGITVLKWLDRAGAVGGERLECSAVLSLDRAGIVQSG